MRQRSYDDRQPQILSLVTTLGAGGSLYWLQMLTNALASGFAIGGDCMRRYIPLVVLFALSPLVAEVLLGATTLSQIGGLLPTSLLYGGGAVLIRELARRRSAGW